MTFWASKHDRDPQTAVVHVTYGPVRMEVDEHIGHLRSFWSELGRLLEDMETELKRRAEAEAEAEADAEITEAEAVAEVVEEAAAEGGEQPRRRIGRRRK